MNRLVSIWLPVWSHLVICHVLLVCAYAIVTLCRIYHHIPHTQLMFSLFPRKESVDSYYCHTPQYFTIISGQDQAQSAHNIPEKIQQLVTPCISPLPTLTFSLSIYYSCSLLQHAAYMFSPFLIIHIIYFNVSYFPPCSQLYLVSENGTVLVVF